MDNLKIESYDGCDWSKAIKVANIISRHDNEILSEQERYREFSVFLYDGDGDIVGGVTGSTACGLCEIGMLAVDKKYRGQGWAAQLMQAAEEIARKRGCYCVNLHTMNFQAVEFYIKLGYTVFYKLSDASGKYTRHFFIKTIKK